MHQRHVIKKIFIEIKKVLIIYTKKKKVSYKYFQNF